MRRHADDSIEGILTEPLRLVHERLETGKVKHGVYEPLSVAQRLGKILRHAGRELDGATDEDHLCAIACNALLAMEARRRSEGDTISDGFGSTWLKRCWKCGRDTMQIVRPGGAQCAICDD